MLTKLFQSFRRWLDRRMGVSAPVLDLQNLGPGVLDPARVFQAGLIDMLMDRRAERRSKLGRAVLYAFMFTAPAFIYAGFYAWSAGYRFGPRSEVVGVVRLEGEMVDGAMASAAKVIPALRQAFESDHVYTALATLKTMHPKPVVAVINNLGASAAYMVALHADRIYAGKYSLVGSIGAVLSGWDAHQALNRLGISQRVYASGELKAMMNPYLAMTPEAERKARELVSEMGQAFKGELIEQRGSKLAKDVDFTSGGVWGGSEAQRLGLVDQVSTLEQVLLQNWPSLNPYEFGPRAAGLPFASAGSTWLKQVVEGAVVSAAGSLTTKLNSNAAPLSNVTPLSLR
jgi:protease IV